MEKFEQGAKELEGAKILQPNEIDQAIECFAKAVADDWPNSREEAAGWVSNEFHNPSSTIFGVYDKDNIVGTCSLVPIDFVFEKMSENERQMVLVSLNQELKIDLTKAIFIGGFSVGQEYEGKGVSWQLFTSAENFAIENNYKALVAHTARPSKKYKKIQSLPIALRKYGMRELPLPNKIFYSSPNDLEKVWLYKLLK